MLIINYFISTPITIFPDGLFIYKPQGPSGETVWDLLLCNVSGPSYNFLPKNQWLDNLLGIQLLRDVAGRS